MRPKRATPADYPGTVPLGHHGMCSGCARRRARGVSGPAGTYDPAYVVGEVDHLIGTDEPDNIARRLGYGHLDSLTSVLTRQHRHDLVERLTRTEQLA
ncbi:hypothetical protein [Haloactinopolyspora alba]|nr:hypothetical protein [Haloactinopolyspora alba]